MSDSVVLLSGELASYATLLFAREESEVAFAVHVQYGQRQAREEAHAASLLAEAAGVWTRMISLPFGHVERGQDVFPGRDLMLVTVAAGVARRAVALTRSCLAGNGFTRHAWGFGCGMWAGCLKRVAAFTADPAGRR